MKFISSLLSLILICTLLLSPSLTNFPISKDNPPYNASAVTQSTTSLSASLPLTSSAPDSSSSLFHSPASLSVSSSSSSSSSSLITVPTPSLSPSLSLPSSQPTPSISSISTIDSLCSQLLTLIPAHFIAHSITASEEINGSLYTEELSRTHSVGVYNLPSYVGYFANTCNRDFLSSSLILNKESSYFLDCDVLVSLDLNDIIAAFPMHDITLDSTTDHLADVALRDASSLVDSLLLLPDQNATLSTSEATPSDLTITTQPSTLNIITLNTLDTPGILTISCEKDSILILRTSNKTFQKTLTITGVPKSLIILPTSDTFHSAQPLYGTILAPATTITIEAPFYGTILCQSLITTAPLNGVTLSTTSTTSMSPATDFMESDSSNNSN